MFKILLRLKDMVAPMTLSRGLDIVNSMMSRGSYSPHWYNKPVRLLIEQLGDVPLTAVSESDIFEWYENVRKRDHARRVGVKLSPYTINSYGRALRAYFNHLVEMGHLEASPARKLKLPKLPRTPKRAISDDDVELMVKFAASNARNYAMLLILRDSGARIGELISMTSQETIIERYYVLPPAHDGLLPKIVVLVEGERPPSDDFAELWRGRSLVSSDKNSSQRWISYNGDAARALKFYLDNRFNTGEVAVWLTNDQKRPLGVGGAYQIVKAIGKRVGATTYNPHAFRHRFVKRLKEQRVDPEIISQLLGHADVDTYLTVYGLTRADDLPDYHTIYTNNL